MKGEKKSFLHFDRSVIILSTMGEPKLHNYKNLRGCRSYNHHKWHFLFPLKNYYIYLEIVTVSFSETLPLFLPIFIPSSEVGGSVVRADWLER
jgi:hypothetical protein